MRCSTSVLTGVPTVFGRSSISHDARLVFAAGSRAACWQIVVKADGSLAACPVSLPYRAAADPEQAKCHWRCRALPVRGW